MLIYLRPPKKSEQTSIHFSEQTFGSVYLYGYISFSPFLLPEVRTRGETRRRSKIPCMQFVKDNFASCINFHCNYPFFVCVHISTKRNTALICTHFHGAETVCAASIGAAIYISLINRAASGFAPLMMLLAVSFYIKLCNNNNNILLLSFFSDRTNNNNNNNIL